MKYVSSHVFHYTSQKINIKGIIYDSYIPLSAYVRVDLSLIVWENAVNEALAVICLLFYFHFLYSELTAVHHLAQTLRVAFLSCLTPPP